MTRQPAAAEQPIRWYSVTLFLGHLGLLACALWSLWHLAGSDWLAGVLCVFTLLGYTVVWRRWIAPASRQRLDYPQRLAVNVVLGSAIVIVASPVSVWLPALVAASVVLLSDSLAARTPPAAGIIDSDE